MDSAIVCILKGISKSKRGSPRPELLPRHEFIRTIETGRGALVMRQIILYWNGGKPALHMKLWPEHSFRKQSGIDAAHAVAGHLRKKKCVAVLALGTRRCLEGEDVDLSAR